MTKATTSKMDDIRVANKVGEVKVSPAEMKKLVSQLQFNARTHRRLMKLATNLAEQAARCEMRTWDTVAKKLGFKDSTQSTQEFRLVLGVEPDSDTITIHTYGSEPELAEKAAKHLKTKKIKGLKLESDPSSVELDPRVEAHLRTLLSSPGNKKPLLN